MRDKKFTVMLNFMEDIVADSEDEAIEIFSELYDIKEKYLDAREVETEEEEGADE